MHWSDCVWFSFTLTAYVLELSACRRPVTSGTGHQMAALEINYKCVIKIQFSSNVQTLAISRIIRPHFVEPSACLPAYPSRLHHQHYQIVKIILHLCIIIPATSTYNKLTHNMIYVLVPRIIIKRIKLTVIVCCGAKRVIRDGKPSRWLTQVKHTLHMGNFHALPEGTDYTKLSALPPEIKHIFH